MMRKAIGDEQFHRWLEEQGKSVELSKYQRRAVYEYRDKKGNLPAIISRLFNSVLVLLGRL
jgi:hypothetical protein